MQRCGASVQPMQRVKFFVGVALIAISFVFGSNARAAVKDDVRDVIRLQLDAFKKNDFETAYGFAHPVITEQFTKVDFERMVRGQFGSMLKPGAVAFAEVSVEETSAENRCRSHG